MKKILLLLTASLLLSFARAQTYFQQQVDYTVDVSLNDKAKTLDGFEKLLYTNQSPDTLYYIWFHLWPNAYKNDRTAFSDQLLENGSTAFYFSTQEKRGYINRLDFKVDGTTAKTEDHPQHIDIIKLILPKPLPPHQQINISTPFHVKLPFNFSRGGYDGQSFQISQWYPKPAVYDKDGWHAMPYLDQGEFYSEFGSYDVRITVPKNYVVAATGELQNEQEKLWLKDRANYTLPITSVRKTASSFKSIPNPHKKIQAAPPTTVTAASQLIETTKTIQFKQNNIHDFAWFANKDFIVQTDSCQLKSGKIIQVSTYYTPQEKRTWDKSITYAKQALRFYSDEVGEYLYPVATVVQGPQSFGGGMEYPTITVISPAATAAELDGTIAHELGHNWFYGILASNERAYPWMDEGINSFYENKYMSLKYGSLSKQEELNFQTKAIYKTDQPIETSSENFSEANYGIVGYHKTAVWMGGLEQKLGAADFRSLMHQYFTSYQFKHPQPDNFTNLVAAKLGNDTTYLTLLKQKGILPQNQLKGNTVLFPLKKSSIKKYFTSPTKNAIIVSPAIGYNVYDQLMLGGLITNYGLLPHKFSFFAAPLFGTGSSTLNGIGKINYATYSHGAVRKTELFLNGSSFTMNEYVDPQNVKHQMRFSKLVHRR